ASGAACLPLDPHHPDDRLALLIADSGARLVLCEESSLNRLGGCGARLLALDFSATDLAEPGPAGVVQPGDPAYVVYTSGSTGRPKGVVMPHLCLSNLLSWQLEQPEFAPARRTLQLSHFGFDVFFQEVLATWLGGGTLVVGAAEIRNDPDALLAAIDAQRIERLFLPPVLLYHLAHAADAAREPRPLALAEVVAAGEQLRVTPELRRMLAGRLVNQYGPSESHVVTFHTLGLDPGSWPDHPPIGRPVANTRIHLLDRALQPVPRGVPGEIYIAGPGLARGYLRQPGLTAERFLPDPFAVQPGERLYRTGDAARHLWDGEIEFLGRLDDQLKIRGFRVEPREIEVALAKHPDVRECLVTEDRGSGRGERLIAYVVPQSSTLLDTLDGGSLRRFLARELPAYMIPSVFLALDAFPLTASGKVDRLRLPAPESVQGDLGGYRPPETALQKQLVAGWERVLGRHPIGLGDNFFELGGHSMLLVRLLAEIRATAGREVSMAILWQCPTIEILAERLERDPSAPGEGPRQVDLGREARLPADLRPSPTADAARADVLLTGATGFVGAFLLRELLDRTAVTVYCLVRAGEPRLAAARLRSAMESYGLWREADGHRVVPIAGDLSRPALGLTEEGAAALARQIGAILHCGATVNFTSPYAVSKAANVGGTIEVLRLAARAGGVPVHAVSTVGVYSVPDRAYTESTPIDDQRHSIVNGYAASKWVAEKLLMAARERGIPTAIY
ncbi:MAG TPA: amino acid adenylation domain-containing protein, partial [Thermoanaerobaculia bacterium]|nr:amino acid adenylation domain-containing protein [Thermoanaerobaculia bacterium]